MTLPAAIAHIEYLAAGSATFVYPFQIDISSELEVRVDAAVMTETVHYTVAGVSVPTGGTVTFFQPPQNGAIVSIRRVVDIEQLLDLVPNAALPAIALEDQLDEIVKQIQMLEEFFSRSVQVPVGSSSTFRYLQLPMPGAGQVIGWNGTGTALTLFDSAIMTVTVSPVSGRAYGITQVTINSVGGTAILAVPSAYPFGVVIEGCVVAVLTTFGNTNGLSTFSMGDTTNSTRWGTALSRTAPFTSGPHHWQGYAPFPTQSSEPVYLIADLGMFDGSGQARITTHWTLYGDVA